MADNKSDKLKQKIIAEMMADHSNTLEKNFDLAKNFIKITKEGKVDISSKEKLKGTEKVLLYLIGKLYAKEAGLSDFEYVDNQELLNELSIPKGSLLPWIKEIRDSNYIKDIKKGDKVYHVIQINKIDSVLKGISDRLKKE